MKKIVFGILPFVLMTSCAKDKAAQESCKVGGKTYTGEIKNILDTECASSGCHDATTKTKGFDFSTYSTSKSGMQNGGYSQITAGLMPTSGKLPDSTISKITQWINDGYCE